MTYADLFFVIAGFAASFVIGLCAGMAVLWKRATRAPNDTELIGGLLRQLHGWEQWYTQHMPACELLERSNQAGRAALDEWERTP